MHRQSALGEMQTLYQQKYILFYGKICLLHMKLWERRELEVH